MRWWTLLVLSVLLGICMIPLNVSAHGMVAGGSRVIEVDAGIHPLRIEVIVPTGAPTVLTLKILPNERFNDVRTLRVSAQAASGQNVAPQEFTIPANIETITVVDIPITALGIWDIDVTIDDKRQLPGYVKVPVTILDTDVPLTTVPLFVAFACLALILTVQVLWLSAPQWVHSVARSFLIVTLTVILGLSAIIASPQIRLEWNAPMPLPMPFISQTVTQSQDAIDFLLHDGATGLPVDDLVPHHNALMHTVCIDEQRNVIQHVHPARVAAGHFKLARALLPAGSYDCSVEVERIHTGSQVLMHHIDIPGTYVVGSADGQLSIPQRISEYDVVVTAEQRIEYLVPVTLWVEVNKNGVPVDAIQPWLGMRGHLVVRNTLQSVYGHVHAVGTMDESFQPMPQVGNRVAFVYAFPRPGRYKLWFQVMTGDVLLTVPIAIDVPAAGD
jgi:hypothetical protein